MDIIVTTPKSQTAAAQEAADCRAAGGGTYFRRFPASHHPIAIGTVGAEDRVYYVEDGYVRGFAVIERTQLRESQVCDTTGREWPPGFYIFMDAASWKWIRPIPMKGFRGFRYAEGFTTVAGCNVEIVGGWLEPKPPTPQEAAV